MKRFIQNSAGNRSTRTVALLTVGALVVGAPFVHSQNRDGKPVQRIATREFNEYRRFLNSSETGLRPTNSLLHSNEYLLDLDTKQIDGRRVRDVLDRFADDAVRLADEMDRAYRSKNVPGIREYLGAAAKLQARVDSLAREVKRGYDLRRVASDFQAIDRDWRGLAHGLAQLPQAGRNIAALVKRIDGHDKQLSDIFHIRPQIDRGEVIGLAAQLRTELQNLADHIESEFGRSSNNFNFILQARRMSEDMRHFQRIVSDNYSYEDVVRDYNTFSKAWREFTASSEKLNSRYIKRDVRRVSTAENELRGLLWLPVQTNRGELLQLTESLLSDVDEFMSRTPLKLIVKLDDANAAIAAADEYNEYCKALRYCVVNGDGTQEIRDCFDNVQRTGRAFVALFQPIGSQAGQAVLRDIESEMISFADAVNYTGSAGYSQHELANLLFTLDNLAEHAEYDVREWANSSRSSIATEAMREATRFADDCHALNERIVRTNMPIAEVKLKVDQLNTQFTNLYHRYLRKAADTHRTHIVQTASRVHETLFDLNQILEM